MYASDGAMMMPERRCAPSPGRQLKSGTASSATFMRNVAEAQR